MFRGVPMSVVSKCVKSIGRLTGLFLFAALAAGCAQTQPSTKASDPLITADIAVTPPLRDTAVNAPVAAPPVATVDTMLADFVGAPRIGKAIVVNIPSYELIAFQDGVEVMRSRVIVGKRATPTPVMETETSVVRFRPTWTPTPRMVRSGKYRPGTRPPGKRNPLGFLAIRLEPGMLIYLHGTNKPQLFDRERRALSHGCVRVERWDEVAAWVLDLSVDDVHARAYGRRTFDMQTSGVPVLMRYFTEMPDADGVMRQYADIYRRGSYAQVGPMRTATY